jgi:hypothetical protein
VSSYTPVSQASQSLSSASGMTVWKDFVVSIAIVVSRFCVVH